MIKDKCPEVGDLVEYRNKFHIVIKTFGIMAILSGHPRNHAFRRDSLTVIN